MSDRWLKCLVQKGMFSDECVIVIKTSGGEPFSAFVPKSTVERSDRVKVRVFEQTGQSWAILPNEDQSIVDVQPSELIVL